MCLIGRPTEVTLVSMHPLAGRGSVGQALLGAPGLPQRRRRARMAPAGTDADLASRIASIRTVLVGAIVLILSTAMWGVGEFQERGVTTEGQDVILTVAVVAVVGLLSRWFDWRFVSPLVQAQDATLLRTVGEQQSVQHALEHELATRQAFIDQANHHLRTPVTIIYGVSELLAERGEVLTPEVRRELRLSVLKHASVLRDVVADLTAFLEREVAQATTATLESSD